MKDLIISATTRYGKNELHNYVESIDRCGFNGDKIMVVYEINQETIDYLKSKGWGLYQFQLQGHIHMHRLLTMYSVLNTQTEKYRYVFSTDVRDVVFQKNPSEYLENNLKGGLLVSSENVLYKNEPWGTKNIHEGYGDIPYGRYSGEPTCNVGVVAGEFEYVKDLFLLNYLLSQAGDTQHFTDQSSYNFLVHSKLLEGNVQIEGNETKWTLQIGTLPNPNIITPQQFDIEDYYIVHQYDRNEKYKRIINQKYE
jgi:hypothetical protein